MGSTRLTRRLRARRDLVYAALIDPAAVRRWMVPDGMTSEIHLFDPREGGAFRISLSYDQPTGAGKSGDRIDTYHGRFVELVPARRVVEVMEFETEDPSMRGEMTVTFTLSDAEGGTLLEASHENVPPDIAPGDNDLGWRMSLDKLAAYLESA